MNAMRFRDKDSDNESGNGVDKTCGLGAVHPYLTKKIERWLGSNFKNGNQN